MWMWKPFPRNSLGSGRGAWERTSDVFHHNEILLCKGKIFSVVVNRRLMFGGDIRDYTNRSPWKKVQKGGKLPASKPNILYCVFPGGNLWCVDVIFREQWKWNKCDDGDERIPEGGNSISARAQVFRYFHACEHRFAATESFHTFSHIDRKRIKASLTGNVDVRRN